MLSFRKLFSRIKPQRIRTEIKIMHRCEYKNNWFADWFLSILLEDSSIREECNYSGDGSDQCWVEKTENFGSENKPIYYCILHAPENKEPVSNKDWTLGKRGEQQARFLLDLLNKWNAENVLRKRNNRGLSFFVLPGINCGKLVLPKRSEFLGPLVLAEAKFHDEVWFKYSKFHGAVQFSNSEFFKDVVFINAEFHNGIQFHSVKFKRNAEFEQVKVSTDSDLSEQLIILRDKKSIKYIGFTKSTFYKDANFNYAEFTEGVNFTDAEFNVETEGKASFVSTKFGSRAYYENTVFYGNSIFYDAKFTNGVDFTFAKFNKKHEGGALFESIKIEGENAIFTDTRFYGSVDFNKAKLASNAEFKRTKFLGNADFTNVSFDGWCGFNHALFQMELNFKACHIGKPSGFYFCEIKKLNYLEHTGENLTFNQCDSSDSWDFRNTDCTRVSFLNMCNMAIVDFRGANFRETVFESCHWPTETYAKVFGHDKIMNEGSVDYKEQLKAVYQQLYKNLENNRDFILSGHFHYQEMYIRHHLVASQGLSIERSILALYYWMGDFGESYKKFFVSMLCSILITTFIVSIIEGFWGQCSLNDWRETIYSAPEYLLSLFLGLIPSAFQKQVFVGQLYWLSKIIIVCEGIILITLTTLFVMAIRRHFRR